MSSCPEKCCQSLTGEEIPEDELKSALEFEDFNSSEQMMCGWQPVHRELHVIAVAYRDVNRKLTASEKMCERLAGALEKRCCVYDPRNCDWSASVVELLEAYRKHKEGNREGN